MRSAVATVSPYASARVLDSLILGRALLLGTTIAVLGLGMAFGSNIAPAAIDPDLARLLRYMALLKGIFAVIAFGVCFWRLARPATLWRDAAYIKGPTVMAGGALCLWHLQSAGFAAFSLHVAMFALLVAGLTDEAFIPARRRQGA